MTATLLYLTTALLTGIQVWWLLGWAIWGAPTNPTQYVSLAGSFALLIAAGIAWSQPRKSALVAIVASIAMWSFYAPALIHIFILSSPTMGGKRLLFTLTPAIFLAITSCYAVITLARGSPRTKAHLAGADS